MKKKQNNSNTLIRSFKSKAPQELRPIYDLIQYYENKMLKDKVFRDILMNLSLTHIVDGKVKKRLYGDLWKELNHKYSNPLKGLVPNAAWYYRLLLTDLIDLERSNRDQRTIYQLLKDNNFKIDTDLRNQLSANNLYPTNVYLSNLAKSKKEPTLPKNKTLRLDYSHADQMFTMDQNGLCKFQLLTKREQKKLNWDNNGLINFQIIIPSYIRHESFVRLCKPLIVLDHKVNKLICQVPYEIKPFDLVKGSNILGVDMGRIKLYSATVLCQDGTYSDEFVPSHEIDQLMEKINRINEHIDVLYKHLKRAKAYLKGNDKSTLAWNTPKQERRYKDYYLARRKRTLLKRQLERLFARELIEICIQHQCSSIHLENLTWVNNRGGKWDFSYLSKALMELAELYKIEVKLVNAKNTSHEHPITKELGVANGDRQIVFKDGLKIDRDQLASLNIALRSTNIKLKAFGLRNSKSKGHAKSRRKANFLLKQTHNLIKVEKDQIVTFFRSQVGDTLTTIKINKNMSCLNNLLPIGFLKYNKLQDYSVSVKL